jgi:molybdate transport system substrate-binding protein
MATPIQELAPQFETLHGPVLLDLGGSETLLPRVLAGASADVFVCHDPFEEKVRQAGKLSRSVEVGQLRPVLLTQVGNPKNVQKLEDLAREGLRLGIGDPRYSTCGELFVEVLKKKGISEGVLRNAVLQARTHTELANGLTVGSLDAVVVWNFVARLYEGKVHVVETQDAYPPVRVTVLGLTTSTNQVQRDAFLDFCATPTTRAVFEKHGYGPPPKP